MSDSGVLGPSLTAVLKAVDEAAVPAGITATPLTAAEIRVLRYLPTHLSLAAIAANLFVSRNTVKTHAIAVYRKLGVSSRPDAVAPSPRARAPRRGSLHRRIASRRSRDLLGTRTEEKHDAGRQGRDRHRWQHRASASRSCSRSPRRARTSSSTTSPTQQATEDLEQQVVALGDKAIGVDADVSKVDDLQTLVDAAVKAFGRLDIMVNNAGVETRTSVLDTTEAQYEKVLEINLKSAFFGTQLAAKQMIAQGGGGRIINITSVHEDWPMPGNTPYCLSKGGVRMLTRTAGVELGPHGITVVGVGPGAVATPINTSTMNDPAKMKTLDAAIPLGRMAEPDEIGSVVAFLAGDGASYITATTVFADGGIMHSSPGL